MCGEARLGRAGPLDAQGCCRRISSVRDEMNRAERLQREGDGRRGDVVGFALTVLQRRLAPDSTLHVHTWRVLPDLLLWA